MDEADEQAVKELQEILGAFGLALYDTCRVATAPPSRGGQSRRRVERIWREVSDKIIAFATKED